MTPVEQNWTDKSDANRARRRCVQSSLETDDFPKACRSDNVGDCGDGDVSTGRRYRAPLRRRVWSPADRFAQMVEICQGLLC